MPDRFESPVLLAVFAAVILTLLALDLGFLRRRSAAVSTREALAWCTVWISLALLFCVWIYFWKGPAKGLEFLTGYLIEEALSVDNLFVFMVIFSYFSVPPAYQHRVLFWGVLGAIVLRLVFILAGAALIAAFKWIMVLFGGFLVVTGIRILLQGADEVHPEQNPVLRLFRRLVPMVPDYHGSRFLVRVDGRLHATPLLLVLVVVEATDVVFAVDSIPAVFAVTQDPLIVYTSNIFAILGLRSLYFLLAGVIDKFRYLKVGLGLVLAFVGVKMLLAYDEHGFPGYHIPIGVSLGVVCALLGTSIIASLVNPPAGSPLPTHPHGDDAHAPPFPAEAEPLAAEPAEAAEG